MVNLAQKLPFARAIDAYAQQRILDAIAQLGRALPATVTAVNNSIVTVKFEVQALPGNNPVTLSQVTIPIACSQWIREPVQIGDQGVVVPADVALGGINGLGAGTATLSEVGNLSALVWMPVANAAWVMDDPKKALINGPSGVRLRDQQSECVLDLDEANGLKITFGGVTVTINASGISVTGGTDGSVITGTSIGVGTTTPTAALDVAGVANTAGGVTVAGAAPAGQALIGNGIACVPTPITPSIIPGLGPIATLGIGAGLAQVGNNLVNTASGGGTVNAGTAGQLGYYAASGTAISGLTLTPHAILLGSSSGVGAVTLADGQLLIGQSSGDPQAKSLSGDVTVTDTGATTVHSAGGVSFGALATLGAGTGLTIGGNNLNVSYANPSASIGLAAVSGVASTAMRSDAAPALSQAITPVWTGFHKFTGSGGGFQMQTHAGTDQNIYFSGPIDLATGATIMAANDALTNCVPLEIRASTIVLQSLGGPTQIGLNNTNPSFALDVGGAVNVSGGFAYGGAAPAGHYLRGNATTYIDATLSIADDPNVTAPATWTPTDTSGGGLTLTVNAANYIKIGKLVLATFNITYPSTADTHSALIGGLPATSDAITSVSWPFLIESSGATAIDGAIGPNSTQFAIRTQAGRVAQTNANMSGLRITGTVLYWTA